MANLVEVKLAIKNNDRKQAMRLLGPILREHPSAEAWYLASRLTQDRAKALEYCKRALVYDSQYKQARLYLIELGGRPHQTENRVEPAVDKFIGFFQDFGRDSSLLGGLHPNVRGSLVAGVLVIIVAVALVVVMQVLGLSHSSPAVPTAVAVQPTAIPPTPQPEVVPTEAVAAPQYQEVALSPEEFEASFAENGYTLISVPGYMAANAPYQYRIQNEDESLDYDVYLFVYDDIAGREGDTYLDVLGMTYAYESHGNAVVYFPTGVDQTTVSTLVAFVTNLTLVEVAPIEEA